ncbi:MAG: hypothetical protein AMJ56_06790 [Anaerolineae bacterium SG8_19]|jgi:hypothetical protein|nr:MAG: hypothetical protein AMJ56_06790 [Anaerolineae bacterium SG8_19]
MRKIAFSLWIILAVFLVACTSEPETPIVTYVGDGCSYSGPTELQTGLRSIVFKDLSDQNQDLWADRIRDGYTYQDYLDLQNKPGEYFPRPSWIIPASIPSEPWVWDESAGARVYTWRFDKPGVYILVVGKDKPISMLSLWICGSIQVVEAPDE